MNGEPQFFPQNTLETVAEDEILQYFSSPQTSPNNDSINKQDFMSEHNELLQPVQNNVYQESMESMVSNAPYYEPSQSPPPPLIANILSQCSPSPPSYTMNQRKRRAGSFAGYPSMHYSRESNNFSMSRDVDDFEGSWEMNGFPNFSRDDTQNRLYYLEERLKALESQNNMLRSENLRLLQQLSYCIKNDNNNPAK